MIATVLLLGLLLVAAGTDVTRHKIYNWTTYPGIGVALALNAVAEWLRAAGYVDRATLERLGWIGLRESLLGFLVCGLILVACYVFLKIGGGDVKLSAMLGAFMGIVPGLEAIIWTFVIGGCAALVMLVWRVGPVRLVVGFFRWLRATIRLRWWAPVNPQANATEGAPLYLSPCYLLAVIIVQFNLL